MHNHLTKNAHIREAFGFTFVACNNNYLIKFIFVTKRINQLFS